MNGHKERRRYVRMSIIPLLMLLLAASTVIAQMASSNYQILSYSLNSGGGVTNSANFGMQNSMGQPTPTGICQSANYSLFAGFQPTTMEEFVLPTAQRGDCNCDGNINVLDVLAVINHILGILPIDPGDLWLADCNGDGEVNILDCVAIVNVILGIGECVPGACKTELTAEALEFLKALVPAEEFAKLMALVKPQIQVPTEYSLGQNYPNPFNPTTDIRYQIPDSRLPIHTTLKVYNILGQEVRTLVDEAKEPGQYTVTWDGKDAYGNDVASGVYFYRLIAGDFTATKRMVLMK